MSNDDAERVGRGQISRGDAKILPLALPLLPKSGLSILRRSEIPLAPGDFLTLVWLQCCLLRYVPCAWGKPTAFLREELDDNPGHKTCSNFS